MNPSDVVLRGTNDGLVEWVSPSVTEVLGLQPAEMVGQVFTDFVNPAHLDVVRATQRRLMTGQRGAFEAQIRHREGGYRWMGVSVLVERVLDEAERSLGFRPEFIAQGAIDELGDAPLVQHVMFSLREMLSNVARHAAASAVEVTLAVAADLVLLSVADNGVGIDEATVERGGYGMANLTQRAELLGGSLTVQS